MNIKRSLQTVILLGTLWISSLGAAQAADKILFIPHDNRPISAEETADVVRKAGYEVVMPPEELLCSGYDRFGDTEALWQWTQENLPGARAAMISSDSMIYGGLVPSRKHEESTEKLLARAQRLADLQKANPQTKLYVFGSLMRTPKSGAAAGVEEPAYYGQYGAAIFRRSALLDKQETAALTEAEKKELDNLTGTVPQDILQDWQNRRDKNILVSKKLIDMARTGELSYLVIGKDDNAPLSQTHREARMLNDYAAGISPTRFQLLAGIDEFGLLRLTRAVNDLEKVIPFVYTEYAPGKGYDTVPSYSDAKIGDSIKAAIRVAGGLPVNRPEKADLILLVNTNANGETGESWNIREEEGLFPVNNGKPRENTKAMVQKVNDYVYQGRNIALADIAFANGADNALMKRLQAGNLLYHLRSYAGWNTATNSTGFALAAGMLASRISDDDCDKLLTLRYLEDWGYQSNVRPQVGRQVYGFRQADAYSHIGKREGAIMARLQREIRLFARQNLPPFDGLDEVRLTLPWHRMFEADFVW